MALTIKSQKADLENLNEEMSGRNFGEELHGTIRVIDGVHISVSFKKKDAMDFDEDKWKYAMIEFKSGQQKGVEVQVASSALYSSDTMRYLNITMAKSFPTLYAGAGVRIKWDLSQLPADKFTGQWYNTSICQPDPGWSDFPDGVGKIYFFDIVKGNANNVIMPPGCNIVSLSGVVAKHGHYMHIDGAMHEVDPITLQSLGRVIE